MAKRSALLLDPDPEKSDHMFGWKLTRTLDPFGNRIEYAYERDATAVDGPHRWDQVYLSEIRYVDYGDDPEHPNFLVSIRFVYELRPDPFSDYRAGFEIRTVRRCVRIEVYTQAADPILTRTYRLIYQDQLPGARLAANGVSLLSRVQVIGHDGAKTQELPPLDFGYSEFQPNRRNLIPVVGEAFPPASLAHPDFELVDVTGNGLPDLVEIGNGARFWPNAGAGSFDLPREMTLAPAGFRLSDPGVQMLDANGDGRPDLMVTNEIIAGYFPLRFGGEWDENAFRPYSSAPSFNLEDPEVGLIDLDGDGVTDAMRAGDRLECFFNDPERGWDETLRLEPPPDPEFPRSLADPRVKLADMTGDGSQDVVVIFDQNVQYWPHLGYGRWADRVDMRNCPKLPYGYDPRRLLLGDVDGDGVADLVYVGDTEITVWINRSGNAWAEPVTISGTPPVNDLDAVRLADLLGNGVSGVLWSSDAGVLARPSMVFLDLTGMTKPYLLHEMVNNMGATTRVGYASSTRFYLEDQKRFRTRWKTPLPFPIQVVAHVEIIDEFSRGKLSTDYIYHHGYWDGAEREFCGFGRVDQRDTEVFENYHDTGLRPDATFAAVDIRAFSPPTETRTWFHPGPIGDEFGEWGEVDFSLEYWSEDPQVLSRPRAMQELLASLPRRVKRDALRAFRGQVLRTELYALDGTEREDRPYTVTEHLYGVREEDPPDGIGDPDRKHIFFAHPLGERVTQWERGSDPMTTFSFSGDYTAYGLTRSRISVAVPRHRDYLEKIPVGGSAPEKYLSTHGVIDYAERDGDQVYIVDRVARATSFEIDNDGRDDIFTLKRDIEKGKYDTDDKLIGQTVSYFDGAATQPSGGAFLGLPFRQIGSYGELTRTETLVLTPRILAEAYKNGASVQNPPELPPYLVPGGAPQWPAEYPTEFRNGMPALAGYVYYDGSDSIHTEGYFSLTNRAQFDFHDISISSPNGLVLASRDALGNETRVEYDQFQFLPKRVIDPVGLATEAEYGDYRVVQPREIIDPNGNRSLFGFSPLGLVNSTWVRGKTNAEGDWARPSAQMEYGFLVYYQSLPDDRQPSYIRAIRQVHHDTETDVPQPERDETVETVEYSDGFGRLLQKRTQADDVLFGEPVFGGEVIPADQSSPVGVSVGRERTPGAPSNVVVGGWQTYNNKGKVVEKFEPFFDQGWDYASPQAEKFGAKVTMFYDPRGHVVRTFNADGSEQRAVYGVPGTIDVPDLSDPRTFEPTPWEAYTYDANDNAGRTHASDPEVKKYDHHWDTPASIAIDALGRTIESVVRNREKLPTGLFSPMEELRTRSTYDILGNLVTVTDPLNRIAFRHVYDLVKSPLRIESIDAGLRWRIRDAAGNSVEQHDSKDGLILHAYDALHRPTRLWARNGGDEAINLRERLEYGDRGDANQAAADRMANQNANLLGKLVRHYDQAGLLSLAGYDFKGNTVEKSRRTVSDAAILQVFNSPLPDGAIDTFRVDWDDPGGMSLDPQVYETSARYDALNRTKALIYPRDVEGQRRELRPKFNRAGALESIAFGGETYIDHIAYDAKGQRVLIAYGNGVMTRYVHDPSTFQLRRLRTERYVTARNYNYQPTAEPLQDFVYGYDLSGNITGIRDRAPECGIPNTLLGTDALDRTFSYDPLYRLLSATGRETDCRPGTPWSDMTRSTDITRARAYTERYRYDAASNIEELKHAANGGGFVRKFALALGNNRLSTVSMGSNDYKYDYDSNGNMVREATSRHFEWDHSDRMRVFRTQVDGDSPTLLAHYLYDAAGQRVKKLVRVAGGQLRSTAYVDGLFEHHRSLVGVAVTENNTLHVMDDRNRIVLVRVGMPFSDDAQPTFRYQLGDHLSSSNIVVGGATATADVFIQREEYTPYGETSFGSFARKRYRFTGKERDEESGLYYFGARYFAPWLTRWGSCDPSGMSDGINLYTYVRGAPLQFVDRLGLQSSDAGIPDANAPIAGAPPPVENPEPRAQSQPGEAARSPYEYKAGETITVPDQVIASTIPYEPDVSHPLVLARARGYGHFESGDARSFVAGAANALAGVANIAIMVFSFSDDPLRIPEIPINPKYQRAANWGNELGLNLAAEGVGAALSFTRRAGRVARIGVDASDGAAPTFGAGPSSGVISDIGVNSETNCFNRAVAFDRRLAGAQASAIQGERVTAPDAYKFLHEIYPNMATLTTEYAEEIASTARGYGEGTRGIVLAHGAEGHAFNFYVSNGQVIFWDVGLDARASLKGYTLFDVVFTKIGRP